jgi:exosome complex RNA-binding protein Rrp4
MESIGFTCKKEKNIAYFRVLGFFIPKKSDALVGRV